METCLYLCGSVQGKQRNDFTSFRESYPQPREPVPSFFAERVRALNSLTILVKISSNRRLSSASGIPSNETHFSPFSHPQEAYPRVSCSHPHARGPGRASGTPRQGACPSERLSPRRRYPRRQRLGTAAIASLLSGGRARKRPGINVLFRANLLGVPRLGLIVPKRVFPRAVDRNRMKRLLRELFRAQQARLGSRDILIR